MATPDSPQDAAPKKRSKMPLFLGIAGALLAGGGGFVATSTGLVALPGDGHAAAPDTGTPQIAFVPVEPVIVSLPPGSTSRHLRMTAQLEVEQSAAAEVTKLLPRILDVLNGYLRALDASQIEEAGALVRIRAQLLRRIQVVAGEGQVRDLLITEFVLN